MEYVAAFTASVVGLSLMAWALHFSRYKRRGGGCCGGAGAHLPSGKKEP